jgi:hypothetical protein
MHIIEEEENKSEGVESKDELSLLDIYAQHL